MQFYRTPDGAWHPTQASAGKTFEPVEVPTDKPNLLAFLNTNCRQAETPLCKPQESQDVEESILSATADDLPRLLMAAVERLGVLGRIEPVRAMIARDYGRPTPADRGLRILALAQLEALGGTR